MVYYCWLAVGNIILPWMVCVVLVYLLSCSTGKMVNYCWLALGNLIYVLCILCQAGICLSRIYSFLLIISSTRKLQFSSHFTLFLWVTLLYHNINILSTFILTFIIFLSYLVLTLNNFHYNIPSFYIIQSSIRCV